MYTLTVDDPCTRCGDCARECPYGIIELAGERRPAHVAGSEARCTACGHCVAICPTGAIHVSGPDLGPAPDGAAPALSGQALAAYLRHRRSVRHFRPEPIPREELEPLLDVMRWAPSGMNARPCSWLVVHRTEEVRRLTSLAIDWARDAATQDSPMKGYFDFPGMVAKWERGEDEICRGAPHLVVCHGPKRAPTAALDGLIAFAHLDAAAPAFGAATCWAGIFHMASLFWAPLRTALALPEGHVPIYTVMVGRPAVTFHRAPPRKLLGAEWR